MEEHEKSLKQGFQSITDAARELLRGLLEKARSAIGAGEGSILVPTSDRSHLRFLVSLNRELDESGFEFACDGSISGFVFHSSQAVAKVKPESAANAKVSEITQVTSEYYLAVPIADDSRTCGVLTFVNRADGHEDVPFNQTEIYEAQQWAEQLMVALRFHQDVVLAESRASAAMKGKESETIGLGAAEQPTAMDILDVFESLGDRDQQLLLNIARSIESSAESESWNAENGGGA